MEAEQAIRARSSQAGFARQLGLSIAACGDREEVR